MWPKASIKDLCDVFTDGDWVEKKDQSSEGIRLIQTGNVGEGIFKDRNEKARYIDPPTFDRLKCTEVLASDCLISRLPDPVGRACIVPELSEKLITAVDCSILRFRSDQMVPEFFIYYSQSRNYLRDVDFLCSGATRKRISRRNLGKIEVPLPPLDEQKRIVAILDQAFEGIDKAIANTEQNLKNARDLFDGHLKKTFSVLEADWPQEKFEEIVQNSLVGLVKSSKEQGPDLNFPYVKMNNITADGRFDSAKLTFVNASPKDIGKYALQDGDFLFNTRNSAELVGKNCIFDSQTSMPTLFNNNIMRIRFKRNVDASFVAYAFRAPTVKSQLEAFVSGTTNVAAIYQKQLKTLKLVLPSLPVQKSTSQALHNAFMHVQNLAATCERKVELLLELKQSLLQNAFSGELTTANAQEAVKVA